MKRVHLFYLYLTAQVIFVIVQFVLMVFQRFGFRNRKRAELAETIKQKLQSFWDSPSISAPSVFQWFH